MFKTNNRQAGFVSILTVLFFIILITIITVGFTRLMMQERQQTLEDDLTKSAYNSAQVGIEDAKRAIMYCASLNDVDRPACETYLYRPDCPGFNEGGYFLVPLGIYAPTAGKTAISGSVASDSPQGYSCVIVKKSTNIRGELSPSSASGAMYEIKTSAPYDKVRISWNESSSSINYPVNTFISRGNPRNSGILNGYESGAPATLRITTINVPNGSFSKSNLLQRTLFVYPVAKPLSVNPSLVGRVDDVGSVPIPRWETKCDGNFGGYSCAVDISYSGLQSSGNYLLLKAIYNAADFQITAYNAGTPVDISGSQITIDSTGYTSGLFRRVQVGVSPGGSSINTSNAIDSGLGLCKDFRVGPSASSYSNLVYNDCQPL